eukprot:4534265-Amphidinium_carterae.1
MFKEKGCSPGGQDSHSDDCCAPTASDRLGRIAEHALYLGDLGYASTLTALRSSGRDTGAGACCCGSACVRACVRACVCV